MANRKARRTTKNAPSRKAAKQPAPKKRTRVRARQTPQHAAVGAAMKRAGLDFPEPFYWTTRRLRAVESAAPDFGADVFDARPLAPVRPGQSSIDFVVDGDSWFNHPFLLDVLDWFNDKQLVFAGGFFPGRTLAEMVQKKRYQSALEAFAVRAVMLSGGGNDLISWNKRPNGASRVFRSADGLDPTPYVDTGELSAALDFLEGLLVRYATDVRTIRPVPIVTHCYDWIVPKDYRLPPPLNLFEPGEWVNPQLDALGVARNQSLRTGIVQLMIDAANQRYTAVCAAHDIIFVDLRGTVQGRWFDEIHPKNAAFEDVADKLVAAAPKNRV